MIFIVAHYFACMFHYVASLDVNASVNWLQVQHIDQETWQIKYIHSLYFAFITMVTVGYGDITPISIKEKVYIIIMTVISTIVFAYTVNTVGQIFQQAQQRQSKLK